MASTYPFKIALTAVGLLVHFSALAQIAALQDKASIENLIKIQFNYKSFELLPLNPTSNDSTLTTESALKYWLRGDFDNDGTIDMLIHAFVETKRVGKHRQLLVFLGKGNILSRVSLENDFSYAFFDRINTSVQTFGKNGKTYLAITAITPPRQEATFGRQVFHDTLSIVNGRAMIYKTHPSTQKINRIEFSTSGCLGSCPICELTVNSNQTIDYYGKYNVHKTGRHHFIITPLDFSNLIELTNNIDLQLVKLKQGLEIFEFDNQKVMLKITYDNGETKTIDDRNNTANYGLETLYQFLFGLRNSKGEKLI